MGNNYGKRWDAQKMRDPYKASYAGPRQITATKGQQEKILRGFEACAKRLGISLNEAERQAGLGCGTVRNLIQGHCPRMGLQVARKIAAFLADNKPPKDGVRTG